MASSLNGRGRVAAWFTWLAILGWAIALGAKIFDLLVLGTSWGAQAPASFARLPYGKDYPIDPGNFFQPLSAVILLAGVTAVVAGWRTAARSPLLWALASFLVIWALTPTVFWPMISDLWEIHRGRLTSTDLEAAALVRRWFLWDSLRIGLIAVGFVATLRALLALERTRPS